MNIITTEGSSSQKALKARLLKNFTAEIKESTGSHAKTVCGIRRVLEGTFAFRANKLPGKRKWSWYKKHSVCQRLRSGYEKPLERYKSKADYQAAHHAERSTRFYESASQKLLRRHIRNGWGGQEELDRRNEKARKSLAARIADHFCNAWPYRRSESSWAGGKHEVSVSIASDRQVSADCEAYRVWSDNGKWSGTNSAASLCISRRAVRNLGVDGLIISGLITLDVRKIGPREYQAVWAAQSRGVSLREERGYIIRGHHVVADSLDKARKTVACKRSAAAAKLACMRVERANLKGVNVTREDSLAGGNCVPGTDAFIAKHGFDERESVPARELLATENSIFTRRAVAAAVARQQAAQQPTLAQAA